MVPVASRRRPEAGRLDADVSGELFIKNQVKLRYEGRFGFAVLRPTRSSRST